MKKDEVEEKKYDNEAPVDIEDKLEAFRTDGQSLQ